MGVESESVRCCDAFSSRSDESILYLEMPPLPPSRQSTSTSTPVVASGSCWSYSGLVSKLGSRIELLSFARVVPKEGQSARGLDYGRFRQSGSLFCNCALPYSVRST